jgi:hypothetical protein
LKCAYIKSSSNELNDDSDKYQNNTSSLEEVSATKSFNIRSKGKQKVATEFGDMDVEEQNVPIDQEKMQNKITKRHIRKNK